MNDVSLMSGMQEIVVDEVFPHSPEIIWKALTSGELLARWVMEPTGFAPVEGTQFTFQTKPAGEWDGVIHCKVLEVIPNERFAYEWKSGHGGNVGYGSLLDTVVTFTLSKVERGTRLRLVHAGFELPKNYTAFESMSEGWPEVIHNLVAGAAGEDPSKN